MVVIVGNYFVLFVLIENGQKNTCTKGKRDQTVNKPSGLICRACSCVVCFRVIVCKQIDMRRRHIDQGLRRKMI